VPGVLSEEDRKVYTGLKRDRNALERKPVPSQDLALSVNHCDVTPPTTYVMIRGNPNTPGKDEIKPGFPAVLGLPLPEVPAPAKGAKSSGRRTVLANWLASPVNGFAGEASQFASTVRRRTRSRPASS
jgi:hypothetical protein